MRFGKYEASDRSQFGTAISFLLIGLGAGAALALLFAPKSGKMLRRDIRRRYDDAVDTLEDWKDDVKERAEDVLDRGAEMAEELRDAAREKVGPFAKAVKKS